MNSRIFVTGSIKPSLAQNDNFAGSGFLILDRKNLLCCQQLANQWVRKYPGTNLFRLCTAFGINVSTISGVQDCIALDCLSVLEILIIDSLSK